MKLTKLCLFLVALFATVCLLGCPGNTEITPDDPPQDDGVNYYDDVIFDKTLVNEIAFFDFNNESWGARDFAPTGDGATVSYVVGEGIKKSNCLRVDSGESYGQIYIDAKDAYSRGKSYYFEAWFRDAGTPVEINDGATIAHLSMTAWDQDIVDIAKAKGGSYYDWDTGWGEAEKQPGPYDASVGTDITGFEKALEPILPKDEDGELAGLVTDDEISTKYWTRLNAVIHSADIDGIVNAEGRGQDDLVGFLLGFYCGTYPAQNGYIFYVDNIRFLDLNPEVEIGLGTYIAPATVEYGDEGSINNLVINIMDGDYDDIWFPRLGARATFTIVSGALPEGLALKDNGDIEGSISPDLVAENGEPLVFKVTIHASNKSGEDEKEVTITIYNQESIPEPEPPVDPDPANPEGGNTEGNEGNTDTSNPEA